MSDVKERVLDAMDDARQAGQRLLEDFKEQTGYFKAKVAVLAGYVAIVVASLVLIPPPGEKNPINARVKVDSISFGSMARTYVKLINEDTKTWEDAVVTIVGTQVPRQGKNQGKPVSGQWTMKERLRPGDNKDLFADKFRDKTGLPPEPDVKVDTVIVEVNGERYVKNLLKKGGQ